MVIRLSLCKANEFACGIFDYQDKGFFIRVGKVLLPLLGTDVYAGAVAVVGIIPGLNVEGSQCGDVIEVCFADGKGVEVLPALL